MDFGIVGVGSITVLCYLAAEVVKLTRLKYKWIPVVCGVVGIVLGIAGMYTMPDFPAHDPISAAAVGVVSGLAATGANQIYKQMMKEG